MKIFWTIVVIIVLVLGFKLLTKDAPAETANNEAATVLSETDATAEEGVTVDAGAETTAN